MHKGIVYVVSCREMGVTDTKEGSYQAANAWWEKKLAEIESRPTHPHQSVINELNRRKDWAVAYQPAVVPEIEKSLSRVDQFPEEFPTEAIQALENTVLAGISPSELLEHISLDKDRSIWNDRLSRHNTPSIPVDRTIKAQVDRHIALERARVDAGQLSVSEFDTIRRCLQDFRDWVGGSNPVESLDSEKWESWWSHLMKMDISIEYKKKKLRYVRSFISWLGEKGMVAVPPNLHSRRYRFGGGAKSVPTIPIDNVKSLIRESPGQLRLHLLLMLNCGMTQTDISDLKPNEVDWDKGRIKRKRSKTEDHANVPTVEYPLWPETFALLLRFGQREGDRALLTESGRTWVRDSIKKDGKRSKVDAIKSNYVHLQRRLGMVYSMKLLRKTSASLLETSPEFARYSTMFLGHSPRSIADRHYVVPSQEQFDRAIGWLGGKLQH
jgi:integrase